MTGSDRFRMLNDGAYSMSVATSTLHLCASSCNKSLVLAYAGGGLGRHGTYIDILHQKIEPCVGCPVREQLDNVGVLPHHHLHPTDTQSQHHSVDEGSALLSVPMH